MSCCTIIIIEHVPCHGCFMFSILLLIAFTIKFMNSDSVYFKFMRKDVLFLQSYHLFVGEQEKNDVQFHAVECI